MSKCSGCGVKLQDKDESKIGYINPNTDSTLCKRCFRLKNYGEYLSLNSNDYYLDIKKLLEDKESLILHIVDIFNIPNEEILGCRKKDSILVLNKRDIFPRSKNENTILNKIKENYPGYMDYITISSINNHNIDKLYNLLISKKINKMYVIGYTNSGKSTLINKLIKNYSSSETEITTSHYPSTTLETIDIKLNDNITLIDTPGIIKEGSILKKINLKEIKKITINKEVRPKIFQFKSKAIYKIDDYCYIECDSYGKNSIVIFSSDNLSIEKRNSVDGEYSLRSYRIDNESEIVISDLCFFKVGKDTKVNIYINDDISIYERKKLT